MSVDFENIKQAIIGHLNNPNDQFNDKYITDIKDKLNRLNEEYNSERQRQEQSGPAAQAFRQFIDRALVLAQWALDTVPVQSLKNSKNQIRMSILDLLQRKPLHQHFTEKIIDSLINVIEKDNEQLATSGLRTLSEAIKQLQQHGYQSRMVTDQNLIRIFTFLKDRIIFLSKFNKELHNSNFKTILGDNHPNPYFNEEIPNPDERKPIDDERTREIRWSIYSISFVSTIPQFYLYVVFSQDGTLREDIRNQVREILRISLKSMIEAIQDTDFTNILSKLQRNLTQELFGAYAKIVQLFSIIIKRDFESSQQQSKILRDLAEQIRLDQIVSVVIKIAKSCPNDSLTHKIELSNRLKTILQYKREQIPNPELNARILEISGNIQELLEDDNFLGRQAKMSTYQKTQLSINWLEIVKNLITYYIPRQEQQGQQLNNLERMLPDFLNNQSYMEKIFNSIFRILFDNSLYLNVHERALEIIKIILEQFLKQDKYFIDKQILQYYTELQQDRNNANQQQNDQFWKDIQKSQRYKLLDRMFEMVGRKLSQIRKQIRNIKESLSRNNKFKTIKKPNDQTNIAQMPSNPELFQEQFIQKLEQYVKETVIPIDENLITQVDTQATPVYTHEDDDDYIANSNIVSNYQQYVEFSKEVKVKIFDQLHDILNTITKFVIGINQEVIRICKIQKGPIFVASNEKKPYFTNLQCHYLSKILKGGLLIFEELHDQQRNHFEILEYKRNSIILFISTFAQISDSINFKNIFEPNAKHILRISVNLNKTCPENSCISKLFQDPMFITIDASNKIPSKQYVEFLLFLYLKELQTTPEQPTAFGFVRSNQLVQLNGQPFQQKDQDEYISILQKLIRLPIRLFPRVKSQEDSVLRPLLKQLILFFIKKSHETYYPIDYLGLLLSLVKRIPQAQAPIQQEQQEILNKYFQQLCDRTIQRTNEPFHRQNLSGVNITLNLFELFKTGIVEIQDIVAELIANFPPQKPQQIQLAKQYPIFAQCLFRSLHNITTTDNQVILKTIVILENIATSLTMDELKDFFGELLQPFMEKLLTFTSELKLQDLINNGSNSQQQPLIQDTSFKSIKILSKLGQLVRQPDWPIEIKRNHNDILYQRNQELEILIDGLQGSVKINLAETVRCATEILQNVLEFQLASYLFKQSSIKHSYQILRTVILSYYRLKINFDHDLYTFNIPEGSSINFTFQDLQNQPDEYSQVINNVNLMNQVTRVYIGLCNINNIIQTLTAATFQRIKEDVEKVVTTLTELFFLSLADQHVQYAKNLTDQNHPIEVVETYVQKHLESNSIGVQWIQALFRGLSKRFMLTAEENINYKDYYIQQHEFVWNHLIMGNCLKKYLAVLEEGCKTKLWAADIFYTVVIRLFEEYVFEKFSKQTQLLKEDDRKKKIQVVQSFGGTMIPSEGLNYRSNCIELLYEIMGLRPNMKQYLQFKNTKVIGLPHLPDIRIYQCSMIFLKQLPEAMKLISYNNTRQLVLESTQIIADCHKQTNNQYWIDLLNKRISEILYLATENMVTYKKSVYLVCQEILQKLHKEVFDCDSQKFFFTYAVQNPNNRKLGQFFIEKQNLKSNCADVIQISYTYSDYLQRAELESTLIGRLIQSLEKLIQFKLPDKMTDIQSQFYANAFRLLQYIIKQKCHDKGGTFGLLQFIVFDTVARIERIEPKLEEIVDLAFNILEMNEKHYGLHGKLIQTSVANSDEPQQQHTNINLNHYLDEQEFKINIEDIDFEIKWQSYLVASIFNFLKSFSKVDAIFNVQRGLSKKIDKNSNEKPKILQIKYRIVKSFQEGLIRVENSIRTTAYRNLLKLVTKEGPNNDKSLFENDEELKKVMKPLLTCVQQDTFQFVPSFIKSLKLILKIFTKVFHRALAERMLAHLQKIVQESGIPQQPQNNLIISSAQEWASQSQESLQFQMGCINGILKLFQHLTHQFNNPNGNNNIAFTIINHTSQLRRNYINRISRNQLNSCIDKPVVKFLNTLAASNFELFQIPHNLNPVLQTIKNLESQVLSSQSQQNHQKIADCLREKQKQIQTIRQVVSEAAAYPLREKLCREKSNLTSKLQIFEKFIDDLYMALERGLQQIPIDQQIQNFFNNPLSQLVNILSEIKIELAQFGYQMCKRNPLWLKRNNNYLENTIIPNVNTLIQKLKQNSQLSSKKQNQFLTYSFYQLSIPIPIINYLIGRYASILKQFCLKNPENTLALQTVMKLILFSPHDKIKKWISKIAKDDTHQNIIFRRKLIEIWLDNAKYKDDEISNQVQIQLGYQVVYPILYHASKKGQFDKIIDNTIIEKLEILNQNQLTRYLKLYGDIEYLVPFMATVRLQDHGPAKFSDIHHFYKYFTIDLLLVNLFIVCIQGQTFSEQTKFNLLRFGYDLSSKSERLVSFYAHLFFVKYRRQSEKQQDQQTHQKFFKSFQKALKSLDESGPSDQEINILCRKIINITLPVLEQQEGPDVKQWVQFVQQQLKQDQSNQQQDQESIQRQCRFWYMFIKNQEIFQKHQQNFTTHIINSMQQILFNQQILPNISNQRRIALDMAFVQVEWKTKLIKDKLLNGDIKYEDFRNSFFQIEGSNNEEVLSSEIYLNFFIKQSLRSYQIDDYDLQKRALYLLKKVFIINPLTITKLNIETLKKNIVSNLGSVQEPNPSARPQIHTTQYFRFFMIVLQVISIMLEFQAAPKIQQLLIQYFDIIINLNTIPDQSQYSTAKIMRPAAPAIPSRPFAPPPSGTNVRPVTYPPTLTAPDRASQHQAALLHDHVQLVATCTQIFRKLIKVSKQVANHESSQFQKKLLAWIEENINNHPPKRQYNQIQQRQQQMQPQQIPKLNTLGVHLLKLFFDYDQQVVKPIIPGMKRIAESIIDYIKPKEKQEQYLLNLKNYKINKKSFKFNKMEEEDDLCVNDNNNFIIVKQLLLCLEDFSLIKDDFPFGIDKQATLYFQDDFPDQNKVKYHLYRNTLIKIMKMVAYNFDEMKEWREQQEYLKLLQQIIEGLQDYEIKLEALAILRVLFLNLNGDSEREKQAYYDRMYREISPARSSQLKKEQKMMENINIKKSTIPYETILQHFFFDSRFKQVFDKKIDYRSAESIDNQQQKIQDQKILKQYFIFLTELLAIKKDGFDILRQMFERIERENKNVSFIKEFRGFLQTFSKLCNGNEYLKFFYKTTLNVFGYNYDRFLLFALGDIYKADSDEEQRKQIDGEESILMATKFLLLGRGQVVEYQQIPSHRGQLDIQIVNQPPGVRQSILENYLGLYLRFKQDSISRWFNQSLKLLTSDYLPSMVIYSQTSIPIHENTQQALRECIIPCAALELMGTAQNVSSRLLAPLYLQIMDKVLQLGKIQHIIHYVTTQNLNNTLFGTYVQLISSYYCKQIDQNNLIDFTPSISIHFIQFIKTIIDKNYLAYAQIILERLLDKIEDEDLFILLNYLAQESQDKNFILGTRALQCTQNYVKKILNMQRFKESVQVLQMIDERHDFWEKLEEETHQSWTVQKETEHVFIHQAYTEALQNLGQWQLLKQDSEQSKVNQILIKMECAQREKQKDQFENGIKELTEMKIINSLQNDQILYPQVIFKLQDLLRDDNNNYQQRFAQQALNQIESTNKTCQIINYYILAKQMPKWIQTYEQQMTSPLLWGSRFNNFISKFQLTIEIEDNLRQFAVAHPYQTQYPIESHLEMMQSAYNTANTQKKYFQERQPSQNDAHQYILDMIQQRFILNQISFQRFQISSTSIQNTQQQQGPVGGLQQDQRLVMDAKLYNLAFVDHKNILFLFRLHKQQGTLALADDQLVQSIIKEVPKPLSQHAERIIQIEKIKYNTLRFKEIDSNLNVLQDHERHYSQLIVQQIPSSEEVKNLILSKILRLKVLNTFYKHLKLEEHSQVETEKPEKLEGLVNQTSDFLIRNNLNHYRFWRDISKVYQIACKKYNMNIQFAQNHILALVQGCQYKPNRYPFSLSFLFTLLNQSQPSDIIQEAFEYVYDKIPTYVLQRYLPQIIIMKQESNQQRIIDVMEKLSEQLGKEILNGYEFTIGKQDVDFNNLITQIYGKIDDLEIVLSDCGKILDALTYELPFDDIQDTCKRIGKTLQTEQQKYKELLQLDQLQDNIKILLTAQTKNQELLKTIQTVYQQTLRYLLYKIQHNRVDEGGFRNHHYCNSLFDFHQHVVHTSLLYNFNEKLNITDIPMPGIEQKLTRFGRLDLVTMKLLFPTIQYQFNSRKKFVRLVSFLGSNEKRYTFRFSKKYTLEKNQKVLNFNPQQLLANQFQQFSNIVFNNHKDTKYRNIQIKPQIKYDVDARISISLFNEETQSLSQIHDKCLIQQSLDNQFNSKIPLYLLLDIKQNDKQKQMEDIMQPTQLRDTIMKFAKTTDTFIYLRKLITLNLGSQYAMNYLIGSGSQPKVLESMLFNLQLLLFIIQKQKNRSNGEVYQKRVCFGDSVYDPHAIRYSRNIETLIGPQMLHSYLIPSFTSCMIALNYYIPFGLSDYVELIFMYNNPKNVEPFLNKLRQSVYENDQLDSKAERLIQLSKMIYSNEQLKLYFRKWF